MAAVLIRTELSPVSSLLPVLATVPKLMVYGLCNTALSVAGQVLGGLEKSIWYEKREAEGSNGDRNREGAGDWKCVKGQTPAEPEKCFRERLNF